MDYAEQVKLLAFFNENGGYPLEYTPEWLACYRAWAAGLTTLIQKMLAESELRQSVTVIDDPHKTQLTQLPPGTHFLQGMWGWRHKTTEQIGQVTTFTIQSGTRLNTMRLGRITPELCVKIARERVSDILNFELQAINMLKDSVDTDHVTLYIVQPYQGHEDLSFLKTRSIGVYGWQEMAVVAS